MPKDRFNFKEFVKKNPPDEHSPHERPKGHKKHDKSGSDKFKKFPRYGLKLGDK